MEILAARRRRALLPPADAGETFQHGTEFVMAQLGWCCRKKKHPLENATQRPASDNLVSVASGVGHLEQRGQPRLRVFQVVGLVQNEQWQSKVEVTQTLLPEFFEGIVHEPPGVAKPFRVV